MHLLWQYFMPSNTYLNNLLASCSSNLLLALDFKYPWRLPPPTYSITRITYFVVSITSYSLIMFWCFIFSISFISLLTLFLLLGSKSLYFLYIFIAIFLLDGLWRPNLTTAYAPYPICFPIMYSSRDDFLEKHMLSSWGLFSPSLILFYDYSFSTLHSTYFSLGVIGVVPSCLTTIYYWT